MRRVLRHVALCVHPEPHQDSIAALEYILVYISNAGDVVRDLDVHVALHLEEEPGVVGHDVAIVQFADLAVRPKHNFALPLLISPSRTPRHRVTVLSEHGDVAVLLREAESTRLLRILTACRVRIVHATGTVHHERRDQLVQLRMRARVGDLGGDDRVDVLARLDTPIVGENFEDVDVRQGALLPLVSVAVADHLAEHSLLVQQPHQLLLHLIEDAGDDVGSIVRFLDEGFDRFHLSIVVHLLLEMRRTRFSNRLLHRFAVRIHRDRDEALCKDHIVNFSNRLITEINRIIIKMS